MKTIIVVVVLLTLCVPFAIIWALNTLFTLDIQVTFWTWLAALVLGGAIGGKR